MVLVQRYGVNLHRGGRHHIGRFLVKDEVVQCSDVYLLVRHDIGGYVFASRRVVEGLHGGVLDAGELADDSLHLFELDAEAANLHLTVFAAHKLYVAVLAVTHDVARAVDAFPVPLHEGGGGLLGQVEVA